MPYIGRNLNGGDRSLLTLSGSTPATSYTLQKNSQNFEPSSAQNLIVSVLGVIQAPGTAYTVSGSTLDFQGVSVASGDVDFVVAMGESVDVGTPSDGTITNSKLGSTFFLEHPKSYSDFTVSADKNCLVAGPITVTGTLTVSSGSTMVVV